MNFPSEEEIEQYLKQNVESNIAFFHNTAINATYSTKEVREKIRKALEWFKGCLIEVKSSPLDNNETI